MASTTPFKFKKEKTYVDEDTFEGVIKKRFKTEKKPTKFTWEGVRNLLATLSPLENPKLKIDRIKALTEGSDAKEKDYIDFFEDIEKGTLSGVSKLGYAVGDKIMNESVLDYCTKQIFPLSAFAESEIGNFRCRIRRDKILFHSKDARA